MPLSWVDYYPKGLGSVNSCFKCGVSEKEMEKSVEILRAFNPRINYRETEYSPEFIFSKTLQNWKCDIPINEAIINFFEGLNPEAAVFDDSFMILKKLKNMGLVTAALTDLPSGMPDFVFKNDIKELLGYIDLYVSSQTIGRRKPNPAGIIFIAEKLGVQIGDILFIGDEEKDCLTAENAGCDFVLIDRFSDNCNAVKNLMELFKYIEV